MLKVFHHSLVNIDKKNKIKFNWHLLNSNLYINKKDIHTSSIVSEANIELSKIISNKKKKKMKLSKLIK